MSGEQAFSSSRSTSKTIRAGTGVGAGTRAGTQASRTALKICCKSSSEYLGILVAARGELARGFPPEGLASWSDNLSPNSGGGEESEEATKGAMEGATEGRYRRGCPRPRIEVILSLKLIFS